MFNCILEENYVIVVCVLNILLVHDGDDAVPSRLPFNKCIGTQTVYNNNIIVKYYLLIVNIVRRANVA